MARRVQLDAIEEEWKIERIRGKQYMRIKKGEKKREKAEKTEGEIVYVCVYEKGERAEEKMSRRKRIKRTRTSACDRMVRKRAKK